LLAGRITEKKVFDEVTTGAQSDLREATKLAKRLITEYGMSDKLGLRTFGEREELVFLGRELHEQRDYSEKTAQDIDEEIYRLTSDAAKTAEKIITEHKIDLDKIAQELLIKETIEAEEFEKLLGKKKTTTD
ncbi:MAG TPA: cell division protein FtsH, partial [bacterium]|nr:cell division protein FtsH [bacterium]